MAKKTANVYVRIEPEVKDKAEMILTTLGMSSSSAINLFYKQIILQNGLPFDVKMPSSKIVNMKELTKEEFHKELEKGIADVEAGRTISLEDAHKELKKIMVFKSFCLKKLATI